MNKAKGLLVVLSSPSGGGKTTVIKKIKSENCSDYIYSVSMTTRRPRNGEVNGKDYWFVTPEEFDEKIKCGELIEYEQVHDWYYGTPKAPIRGWLKEGKVVLLDLDVFGALHLKEQLDQNVLLIFLSPPNQEALLERLKNRSTESKAQIDKRLQRVPVEMSKADQFDAIVVNDDLDQTVGKVIEIINNKRNTN